MGFLVRGEEEKNHKSNSACLLLHDTLAHTWNVLTLLGRQSGARTAIIFQKWTVSCVRPRFGQNVRDRCLSASHNYYLPEAYNTYNSVCKAQHRHAPMMTDSRWYCCRKFAYTMWARMRMRLEYCMTVCCAHTPTAAHGNVSRCARRRCGTHKAIRVEQSAVTLYGGSSDALCGHSIRIRN